MGLYPGGLKSGILRYGNTNLDKTAVGIPVSARQPDFCEIMCDGLRWMIQDGVPSHAQCSLLCRPSSKQNIQHFPFDRNRQFYKFLWLVSLVNLANLRLPRGLGHKMTVGRVEPRGQDQDGVQNFQIINMLFVHIVSVCDNCEKA